jgi:hypothetical protein
MVQRTYYSGLEPDVDPVRWEPAPDDVHTLRHGYNLADINRLARMSASTVRMSGFNYRTGYELAWSAIAELLYTSPEPPTPVDLTHEGWNAIRRHVQVEMRHHGKDSGKQGADMPRFMAYWESAARRTAGPESAVVERVALWQIWPRLLPSHREALGALAALGDYRLAAEACGRKDSTFRALVADARKAFLALWHEHERPSRPWGQDKRAASPDARPAARRATRSMERRRERDAGRPEPELVHGKPSTYRRHACRCRPCTDSVAVQAARTRRAAGAKEQRRITAPQLAEARVRREAGETIASIAADLGFSRSALSIRLSGKSKLTRSAA